jgi:hypothetical protein
VFLEHWIEVLVSHFRFPFRFGWRTGEAKPERKSFPLFMPVQPGIPSFSSSQKILDPDRTTDAVRTVSPIPKAMLAAPGHAHDRNEEARQGRRVSKANKNHEGRKRPE